MASLSHLVVLKMTVALPSFFLGFRPRVMAEAGNNLVNNDKLLPLCWFFPVLCQECVPSYSTAFISFTWWSSRCLWPFPSLVLGFRPEAMAAAERSLARAQVRFHTGADTSDVYSGGNPTLPSRDDAPVGDSAGPNSASGTGTSNQRAAGRRHRQWGAGDWDGAQAAGGEGGREAASQEGGAMQSDNAARTDEYGSWNGPAPVNAGTGHGLVGKQAGRQVAVLSEATRKRVISAWMYRDMGRYSIMVCMNFALLSLSLVALITVALWVFQCLRSIVRWLFGYQSSGLGAQTRGPHGMKDSNGEGGNAAGGSGSGGDLIRSRRIGGRDGNGQAAGAAVGDGILAGSTSQSLFSSLFGSSARSLKSSHAGSQPSGHGDRGADREEGEEAAASTARLATAVKAFAGSVRGRGSSVGGGGDIDLGGSEDKPASRRRSGLLDAVLLHARRLSMDGSSNLGEVKAGAGNAKTAESDRDGSSQFTTPTHSGSGQGTNVDKSAARNLFASLSERVREKEVAPCSAPPKLSGAYYRAADGQWRRFKSADKS